MCCAPADPTDEKNPKYKCARGCSCCGTIHEFFAFLVLGALQIMVWMTVSVNCREGGPVKIVSDLLNDPWIDGKITDLEKACDSVRQEDIQEMCREVIWQVNGIRYGSMGFCNLNGITVAMSILSIICAIAIFTMALMTTLKCCNSCCGRKTKHLSLAIACVLGFIISVVTGLFHIFLSSNYGRYSYGYKEIFKTIDFLAKKNSLVQGAAMVVNGWITNKLPKEPLIGSFAEMFTALVIICIIWEFLLALQRLIQLILSSCACCTKFQEKEMVDIQVA